MNDTEINEIIAELPIDIVNEFAVKHKVPVTFGSGHSVEIESKTCLGTVSVWATGMMDWHIFDITTSTEALLGYREVKDVDAVREVFLIIFDEIRCRDNVARLSNSSLGTSRG